MSGRAEQTIVHTTQSVTVTGTCAGPEQHTVTHQMTVPAGGHGVATADANCGACGAPVHLAGSF